MPKKIHMEEGDKFGKLTFISWVQNTYPRRAVFRCDCGNEKQIIAFNVRSGRTKSCGCISHTKEKVKVGDVFGKWTVIETGLSKRIGKKTFSACKCKCSCEKQTVRILALNSLCRGLSKSCGCKIKDIMRDKAFPHRPRMCYGYRYVYCPTHPYALKNCGNAGYIMEHRLIMEQHIGRYLTEEEVVHHKDRNKVNNDISNLQLMTIGEHTRLHALEDCKKKRCVICNKEIPIGRKSDKCSECIKKLKEEKAKRKPSKKMLLEMLRYSSYAAIGRECGVTGACIKKWEQKYGIPIRNRRVGKVKDFILKRA